MPRVDVSDEERQAIRDERRAVDSIVESFQGGELARLVLAQRNRIGAIGAAGERGAAIQRLAAKPKNTRPPRT